MKKVTAGIAALLMLLVGCTATDDEEPTAAEETATVEEPADHPLTEIDSRCEAAFDRADGLIAERTSQYTDYVRVLDGGEALVYERDGGAPRPMLSQEERVNLSARQDQHELDRDVIYRCILEGIDASEAVATQIERTDGDHGIQTATVDRFELSWSGSFGLLELLIEDTQG